MVNLKIFGFGEKVENQIICKKKLENLLEGIKECRITIFEPSNCVINSRQVGSKEDTPYLEVVYSSEDVESEMLFEIIERLEAGGIKIPLEYHHIPLTQATPDTEELVGKIRSGII